MSAHGRSFHQIDTYKALKEYKREKSKEKRFRNKDCKKELRDPLEDSQELFCEKCDYETGDRLKLQKHLCYRFRCELCDFRTSLLSKSSKHYQELHPNDFKYKCDECKFVSLHKYLLKRHKQRVHSGEIFKCELCDYQNKDGYELTRHNRQRHNINPTPKDRHYTFTSKDKTKFPCYICSNINEGKLKHVEHLCSHKIITNAEGFSCSDCDFEVKDEFDIRRHVEIHLKIESNHCKECNATFSRLDTFAVHLRTKHDADEKTDLQTCTEANCKYSTKRKDAMKRHIDMVHKKVRYKCTQCQYNNTDQRQVKLHFEKKHKAEPLKLKTEGLQRTYKFKCEFCQYSVSDRRSLRGHLELKHGSDIKMDNVYYSKDEILEYAPKVVRIENSELLKEHLNIKKDPIETKSNLSNLRLRLRLGR